MFPSICGSVYLCVCLCVSVYVYAYLRIKVQSIVYGDAADVTATSCDPEM